MVFDREPQSSALHATVHVTPLLAVSFPTVAVKFKLAPARTVCGVEGEIATVITGAGVTVIVTLAFFVVSAFDFALSVTVRSSAKDAGAA